ncbi:acyltransferase family protein [Sphingomonas zeae]
MVHAIFVPVGCHRIVPFTNAVCASNIRSSCYVRWTFPFDGYILSFSRTLVFLPFFIAGTIYGSHFRHWLDGVPRLTALLSLVLLVTGINSAAMDENWLRGALTYGQMNAKPVTAIGSRAIMLIAALLSTLCFLRTVGPSRWLARYGRHTLPVYLFHAPILLPLGKLVGPDILHSSPMMLILIAILAALALTHGLALNALDWTIRRIFYSASAALLGGR